MAKGTKETQATGKLAGKTVAFVGKFGYRDMFLDQFANQVVRAGGEVVDAAKTIPDYLFVGEGRGGNGVTGCLRDFGDTQLISLTDKYAPVRKLVRRTGFAKDRWTL